MMCEHGEITPKPDYALFADTKWEPPSVYDHLDWLETQTSIPILRVSNGRNLYEDVWNGVGHDDHLFTDIPVFAITHRGEAQLSRRQCTCHYKIVPLQAKVRELLGRRKGARTGPRAVQYIGISTDEAHRMKPSGVSWIDHTWPLVDVGMSRIDCVEWFADKYPAVKLPKSSCIGCPFHNDALWLQLSNAHPKEMAATIALDHRLRSPDRPQNPNTQRLPEYLHRSARPLGRRNSETPTQRRRRPSVVLV